MARLSIFTLIFLAGLLSFNPLVVSAFILCHALRFHKMSQYRHYEILGVDSRTILRHKVLSEAEIPTFGVFERYQCFFDLRYTRNE
jgi:hypothetical protein